MSQITAPAFMAFLQQDAGAFFNDFSEVVTYRQWTAGGGGTGTFTSIPMLAIVDRPEPEAIRESNEGVSDVVMVSVRNDATTGVTSVTPNRDLISVAGRWGGLVTDHVVALVDSASDAGVWKLRLRS